MIPVITSRQKPPLRVVMLSRAFYERRTLTVARNLLGKYLVRRHPDGTTTGRIVETEAYIGPNDRASHASRGRTPRTALMFGPAGFAYVYLIYGVYHCLNIVTEREGFPSAVLLRAIEPVEGLGPMRARRKRTDGRQVAGGPGKLCQAFAIDLSLNGVDMCGETLYVEDRGDDPPAVVTGSRIGVDYAGPWRDKPWRFCIPDNPHLSRTIGNPVRKRKS